MKFFGSFLIKLTKFITGKCWPELLLPLTKLTILNISTFRNIGCFLCFSELQVHISRKYIRFPKRQPNPKSLISQNSMIWLRVISIIPKCDHMCIVDFRSFQLQFFRVTTVQGLSSNLAGDYLIQNVLHMERFLFFSQIIGFPVFIRYLFRPCNGLKAVVSVVRFSTSILFVCNTIPSHDCCRHRFVYLRSEFVIYL